MGNEYTPDSTGNPKVDPIQIAEHIYSEGHIDSHLWVLAEIIRHIAKKGGFPIVQFGFMVLNEINKGDSDARGNNKTEAKEEKGREFGSI